jgi:uncharacterized protein YjbI with pentapeptide repeats
MSEKEKQNSLFFKQRYVSDWGIYLFRWIKEVGNFPLLKTYSFLDIISSKTIKKNYLLIITGCFLFGLFLLMIFAVWKIPQIQVPNKLSTAERERITLEDKVRTTLIQAIGGSAIFITGCFALLNYQISQKKLELDKETSQKNLELADSKQITERFSKAVEQLGEESITIRLGAIYSLERIAKNSKYDHWTIMEVLTAFIREKSNDNREPESKILQDIQAALTVIGRRNTENDLENERIDLRGANLNGANLSQAKLDRANFKKAELNGADMSKAKLNGAILVEAKLSKAKLWATELNKADLSNAELMESELTSTQLQEAILIKANLENAHLVAATLAGANLKKANLASAILGGAKFKNANLRKSEFREIDLKEADFSEADLTNARLTNANLSGAKFSNANLRYTEFGAANLTGVSFCSTDLTNTFFEKADLIKANFSNANLKHICFIKADLTEANFSEANLTNTDFYQAKLIDAKFDAANLDKTSFNDADIENAYFRDINRFSKGQEIGDGYSLFSGYIKDRIKNLAIEQIIEAKNWNKANYNPDFEEELQQYLILEFKIAEFLRLSLSENSFSIYFINLLRETI